MTQIGAETEINQNTAVTDSTKFTREEAARYLRVSIVSIDRAIAKRAISFFRIGRRVIFGRHHLDDFLSKNEVVAKVRSRKFQYGG